MGSRVRIRLGVRFDILRFVRNLLFPLLKNSKSDVDERGHCLRFFHTRRRLNTRGPISEPLCTRLSTVGWSLNNVKAPGVVHK